MRLESGLAFQRDEAGPDGALAAHEHLHEPDPVVRGVSEEERERERTESADENEEAEDEMSRHEEPQELQHGASSGGVRVTGRSEGGAAPRVPFSTDGKTPLRGAVRP